MKLKLYLFILFSLFLKGAISQNITDIVNLGGTGNTERISSITTDSQGNIYLLHLMNGNAMFENTQVPSTYTSFRTFVTKLNANRQLVWMKEFNYYPPAETKGERIAVDAAGNVYITDQYFLSFSAGPFTLNGSGYRNFTYKLDSNGTILWVVEGGGRNIQIAPDGNLELMQYNSPTGTINGSTITNSSGTVVWINPSNGSYVNHFQYDTPTFGTEILLKRNAAENFYGYRRIGNQNQAYYNSSFELIEVSQAGVLLSSALTHYGFNDSPNSITQDSATGHYYISTHFNDRVPLNAPTAVSVNRFGILRVDQNMQVIDKIYLGGPTGSNLIDNFFLSFIHGALYFSGKMNAPSQVYNWSCIGQPNYLYPHDDKLVIGKLSPDLNVRWYNAIPGFLYDNSIERPIGHNDDIIFSGSQIGFNLNGATFTPNGNADVFLLNVFDTDTTDILIEGSVFHDLNQDGIRQAGEEGVPYWQIGSSAMPGITYYTREDGTFSVTGMPGQQHIYSPEIPPYWTYSTPNTIVAEALQADTTIQGINFGCYPVPGITDISGSILPLTAARPGFQATYRAEVCNEGTETSSGIFYVKQSLHLTYTNSTLAPDSIHQDTLFFSYTNLEPNQCFSVEITDQVFNGNILGTNLLQQMGVVTQTPDTLESNNTDFLLHTVTGSYDPNDISVYPACGVTSNFVAEGNSLDYFIRFQNTGSDTAFTVIIKDTLSPLLDISTFEFKGTSHGVNATISNNVLTLLYNAILLTDSTTNGPESKGWFRYSIKPLASVTDGDSIKNTAAIFFDYNAPIITNTVHTMIADPSDLASVTAQNETCDNNGALAYEAFCETKGHFVSLNGGPFSFDETGIIPNLDAGVYTLRISNLADTLTVGPVTINYTPVSGTALFSICHGDSVFIGGAWQQNAGVYMDIYQTALGCDSMIYSTLHVNPLTPVIISASNNVLSAPLLATGTIYQWVDCQNNNQPIGGQNEMTFTPVTSGIYAVQTTNGPCNFLSNCIAVTILGVSEIRIETVSVSPNPFDELLTISFDEAESGLLVLSETSGKVVLQQAVNSEEIVSVHTWNIAHGVYILNVFRANGELLTTKKMVK